MAGKKYGESNAQHCEGKPGKSSSKKQENPDEFREEQESGKAALATLWRREPLRLPFGPCLSPTCQQSSQVLSVKYQSGVLLLSLGWMPEKEAWRIGEYPQRLCHVLKEMVEEKAAQERGMENWRISAEALPCPEGNGGGEGSTSSQPVQLSLNGSTAFSQSSQLRIITNLLRVAIIPSSRSLMKMLNKSGPSTDPWGTPLVTGLQPDSALPTTTLCALPVSQFSTHLTVHSSIPHLLSFVTRMWWGTASKALLKSR
ncbi:uncharacterized protein LOC125684319 isoform X1 [Lagopus muta]|uniref:uncharacterized protein LOC125684319 isoform X1 n=1 Tax=Lagopus muta TaxID=64668 RepID=UPI00209DEBF3|nr:uncharacterized protein LOC125684319 isoform X1 [Lagopus muta]XP_048782345.1 uncharacterized protein LOC125684319 isoform X1 [Lagopus muta]XP_048782346.1 uncharacterized protein LOC125684319 isoform X1 [Lagopus muta]